jgi:hypothetical protein
MDGRMRAARFEIRCVHVASIPEVGFRRPFQLEPLSGFNTIDPDRILERSLLIGVGPVHAGRERYVLDRVG